MGFSPTPLPATPPENIHIASCSLRQRKTRRFWLECLILRVSECQGDCFLCLFGCKKNQLPAATWKKRKKTTHTSRISLIFEPPLPISEPHWLPGKTRRSVTGGLLVTLLFVIAAVISWGRFPKYVVFQCRLYGTSALFDKSFCVCARVVMQDWRKGAASVFHAFGHTSSNFCAIMEKALKMPSVGPVMVTILSGDEPSDMLMRAPLWKQSPAVIPAVIWFDLPDNVKLYALSHYRCQSKHSPPPSFSWLFLLSEIRQEKKSVRLDL